jgi:hypothetical protein
MPKGARHQDCCGVSSLNLVSLLRPAEIQLQYTQGGRIIIKSCQLIVIGRPASVYGRIPGSIFVGPLLMLGWDP